MMRFRCFLASILLVEKYVVHCLLNTRSQSLSSPQRQSTLLRFSSQHPKAVQKFVAEAVDAIGSNEFFTLTLRGPSKKYLKAQSNSDETRGCLRMVTSRLIETKQNEKLLQVTFKYHMATDVAKNWHLDEVERGYHTLLLNEANQGGTRSVLVPSEWGLPASSSDLGLQSATLELTTGTIVDLDLSTGKENRRKGKAQTVSLDHDRAKNVPLSREADFLQLLGLTNSQGKPRAGMKSKLRQCQRFVEIVSQRIPSSASSVSVTDMGCGRGYLTFALHHYLSEHFPQVQSLGIDVRPKLVKEINGIAETLGGAFSSLKFSSGTIQEHRMERREDIDSDALSILIALHACNTATDDALWAGIENKADILVVAPCCHQQVRPQLDYYIAQAKGEHPLADVLQHKIHRERQAEMVTDTLRGLLLELAGYSVQVFEFIGGEHTSKNVMILAVKNRTRRRPASKIKGRIQALSSLHGVFEHQLAQHMGHQLVEFSATSMRRLSVNRMPPLQSEAKIEGGSDLQ